MELVPVSRLYGGAMFFAGDRVAEVLSAWSDWTGDLPEEMTSSIGLLRVPPLPEFPEALRGKLVGHVRFAYLGSASDGEQLIEPLRALGPEIMDTVAEMPFPPGRSTYSSNSAVRRRTVR
jgi:hypothetical protein